MDGRKWHHHWQLVLLAAAVAACGSESRANEAEESTAADAAAETVYVAQDGPGTSAAGQPAAEQEAPATAERRSEPTRARQPASTPPAEEEPAYEPPADPEPAAEPAAVAEPEPATATVAAGTALSATLDRELSTKTTRVGDGFTATVSSSVVDGRTVLVPEGAMLRGTVTGVQKKSGDRQAAITVAFDALEIEGREYPLEATLTGVSARTEREMKDEGKKIGGGAAAGGLLGALIGGDVKGAVIGAAAGAAAGTAITLATREEHAVLPAGSAMTVRLDRSLEVRM